MSVTYMYTMCPFNNDDICLSASDFRSTKITFDNPHSLHVA